MSTSSTAAPTTFGWMSNPQYLAQIGHTLGGYGLIATAAFMTRLLSRWSAQPSTNAAV